MRGICVALYRNKVFRCSFKDDLVVVFIACCYGLMWYGVRLPVDLCKEYVEECLATNDKILITILN